MQRDMKRKASGRNGERHEEESVRMEWGEIRRGKRPDGMRRDTKRKAPGRNGERYEEESARIEWGGRWDKMRGE